MGYQLLSTYDTQLCSQKCDKVNGCLSFNLYFERDPSGTRLSLFFRVRNMLTIHS